MGWCQKNNIGAFRHRRPWENWEAGEGEQIAGERQEIAGERQEIAGERQEIAGERQQISEGKPGGEKHARRSHR